MELDVAASFGQRRHAAWRALTLAALGPLTVLSAIVWGVAQPYRITLLDPLAHGAWDHIAQPPILVAAVGVLFHVVIGRPLGDALEVARDTTR